MAGQPIEQVAEPMGLKIVDSSAGQMELDSDLELANLRVDLNFVDRTGAQESESFGLELVDQSAGQMKLDSKLEHASFRVGLGRAGLVESPEGEASGTGQTIFRVGLDLIDEAGGSESGSIGFEIVHRSDVHGR